MTEAERPAPLCRAPETSMHLDPGGWATACAANYQQRLGNVANHSLAELWNGIEATALRHQLGSGRYGSGCNLCRWQDSTSGPEQAYARLYDGFEPAPATAGTDVPSAPVRMDLSLSNRCNLRCVMCNGGLSSSIRTQREHLPPLEPAYPDRFFDELRGWIPGLRQLKFLGGEPFLAPENHRIWNAMIADGLRTNCHVTTNGTVWNASVQRVVDHLPMSFSVSMDGIRPETVEAIRVGASFDRIMEVLGRIRRYTQDAGTHLSLTFCLMRLNWRDLADFLRFADEIDVSVFVNTVLTPARLSLYKLERSELAEVVAALGRQDDEAQRTLGRNLPVWDDQLHRLRNELDGASRSGRSDIPVLDAEPDPQGRDPDAVAGSATAVAIDEPIRRSGADALAGLRRWAESEPVVVELAPGGGPVRSVGQPGRLEHLDLHHSVGMGTDEVIVLFQSAFGMAVPPVVDPLAPGEPHAQRRLVMDTATRRTELRAVVLESDRSAMRVALATRVRA